jgi:hypothetical protein
MKSRLEELAAERREREAAVRERGSSGGWGPGGYAPARGRSGRRGNR